MTEQEKLIQQIEDSSQSEVIETQYYAPDIFGNRVKQDILYLASINYMLIRTYIWEEAYNIYNTLGGYNHIGFTYLLEGVDNSNG